MAGDIVLRQRVRKITPKMNASICNGLAVEHMAKANEEVDRIFKCTRDLFPKGLVYMGSRPCTPIKMFEELTREYGTRRVANIAKHNVYMMEYNFNYTDPVTGVETALFPRYVLMPFVTDGGLIHLNGALYHIAPVLADIGFSVGRDCIFVAFRRTKITFFRTDYGFNVNGVLTNAHVIYSPLHHQMNKAPRSGRELVRRFILSSLPHYFFGAYGVTKTFEHYGKTQVSIGLIRDYPVSMYPPDKFAVYRTAELNGKHPLDQICLVVPKENDTAFVQMLAAGFFYVADTFPDSFIPRDDSPLTVMDYVDDTSVWRSLLGQILYGDYEHRGKLLENMNNHYVSLETQLDELTREELRERNIHASNIYDLLYYVMTDLHPYFYMTSSTEASMFNKRLTVLRYVLNEFNTAISRMGFDFQSLADKQLKAPDIDDVLKKWLKLNTAVRDLNSTHGEINAVSYPGSNKIMRLTTTLVPQDRATRSKGYTAGLIADSSRLLHASIAVVGQFNNLPKTNPDGRARASMWLELDIDGRVREPAKHKDLIDETQRRITGL